jgi:hypothetical protein
MLTTGFGLAARGALCVTAAALTITAAASAQAATVKDVFEKYNLVGTLAADCSKPGDAKSLYLINRAIDADHVQIDKMTGPATRDFAMIINTAAETKPNEITLTYTVDDQPYNGVFQVERGRLRIMEQARLNGEKQVAGGRIIKGGAQTSWYGRCQQQVTIHISPQGGGNCLGVLGDIKPGAHLEMQACNDTPRQIFGFDTINGQLAVGDFCVDVDGGRAQPSALLPLAECNGAPTQMWKTDPNGNGGFVKLVNNNLCIDIAFYGKVHHSAVQLWRCHGESNQSWQLQPALTLTWEDATNRDGTHTGEFDLVGADPKLCQEACVETRACTAWVYRKPEATNNHHPHCWMLDKTTKVNKGDAVSTSGTVRPEDPPPAATTAGCRTENFTFSAVLSQSATANSVSAGGAPCIYNVAPIHPDQVQFTSASIVKQASNGTFEQTGAFAFKYQPGPGIGGGGTDEYAIKVCGHDNQRAGCATVTFRVTVK